MLGKQLGITASAANSSCAWLWLDSLVTRVLHSPRRLTMCPSFPSSCASSIPLVACVLHSPRRVCPAPPLFLRASRLEHPQNCRTLRLSQTEGLCKGQTLQMQKAPKLRCPDALNQMPLTHEATREARLAGPGHLSMPNLTGSVHNLQVLEDSDSVHRAGEILK